jgi:hypothetical protein
MKLEAEVTRREYCVAVPIPAMKRLLEREREGNLDDMLSSVLDELPGVSESNYDGHFGANVFFRIDAEDDSPELRKQILTIIGEHLA